MNKTAKDRGEFRGLNELKNLHGRKKLEYIWNYYKIPLVILAIAVYVIIYVFFRRATDMNPYLYLAYVNVSAGEDLHTELEEDFLAMQEDADERSIVSTYEDLLLTEAVDSTDTSYLYACQMKILAAIDGEEMDLVLMDKEAYDAFAQNGYLYNLEDFLTQYAPELTAELSPLLTNNIEILEDNATEVTLDNSIPYEAVTEEYPMAFEVSSFSYFGDAGFSDEVYLGIIANTPRSETVVSYLKYLLSYDN